MDYITNTLREYPVIALFLTVGLGFLCGRIRYKAFSLGSVTAGLLIGILIGQLDIPVSDQIKNFFFMLFLFSIGYSVGPGFFRSLKGVGLKQAGFAVAMGSVCFAVTVGLAHLCSYSAGETVGLFSGAQTCSSLIGVGSEAIQHGLGTPEQKAAELNMVPICYAVTYVFGTLGTIIILSMLGPKLLGGMDKVKKQVAELEKEYSTNTWQDDPAYIAAMHDVAFRAYKVVRQRFAKGISVKDTEKLLRDNGMPVFVDRIHRPSTGEMRLANPSELIYIDDIVVLSGRTEHILGAAEIIGEETAEINMLNYPVKQVPVLVRNKKIVGIKLSELSRRKFMHGVIIKQLKRNDEMIVDDDAMILRSGDTLTIVGPRNRLNRAAAHLGHIDRPTTHTDIMFLCLTLFIGGAIGSLTIMFDRVPLSFGTSGGSLIAGLVFGWLRSKHPTYGHIPRSVLWFMNQLGLNTFIAVVGLKCGPSFIAGIKSVGWLLPVVGAVATTLPLLAGLLMGNKLFKFNPAFTLGCCAGTRTCTAALGAVQDALGSNLPTIGYTVTFAVSNILLIIWGLIAVLLA